MSHTVGPTQYWCCHLTTTWAASACEIDLKSANPESTQLCTVHCTFERTSTCHLVSISTILYITLQRSSSTRCCFGEVSFQLDWPIFRGLPTENPLTNLNHNQHKLQNQQDLTTYQNSWWSPQEFRTSFLSTEGYQINDQLSLSQMRRVRRGALFQHAAQVARTPSYGTASNGSNGAVWVKIMPFLGSH